MCVSYGSIFAKGEVLVEFKLTCVLVVLILEMGWHQQEYFILGSLMSNEKGF